MNNIRIFYLKIFLFLVVKFSVYLNRRVFVMVSFKVKTDPTLNMYRLVQVFAGLTGQKRAE